MKKYELLEHVGDLKIRAFGENLKEAFANAALAMMAYIYGKEILSKKPDHTDLIELTAEALLVDWLGELLYLSNTAYRAYVHYEIKELSEQKLVAVVGSLAAQAVEEIKAVTHHDLAISQKEGRWEITVVYDI